MSDALFYLLAATIVVLALAVVRARNLYRAAYALAGVLVTTATFYLLLSAPLLAAVQILLYTGGVLTLVIFALVMSARPTDAGAPRKPLAAAFAGLLVAAAGIRFATTAGGAPAAGGLESGTGAGRLLFTSYVVPFELLSLLLLGALFGALVIARKDERP